MATKINAADVNVMTFNADPFLASDEYGKDELQALLNEAYITEFDGYDAEQAREMLVEHVLKPAAKFFCADNDDMDNEIINEELAKWN